MRAALLAWWLVLAAAPRANAFVILEPTIVRLCPGAPSWGNVASCLERFGTVKVLRDQGGVKLVQLRGNESDWS